MPATLHIHVPLQFYCSPHIDIILLHIHQKVINSKIYLPYYCKYVLAKDIFLKCHIYGIGQNCLMCISGGSMLKYMAHKNSLALAMWPGLLTHKTMTTTMQDDDNDAKAWLHILSRPLGQISQNKRNNKL